ncbi:hypothetical protein J5N97_013122 [Dioscorea zingiberensis]|uniref:K+ potassium transporter integral membrane domain-containing protein n=1 Tax=Dioscorea zingiberensis TaxID=325984 RepID=A0A9D5CSW3_9LILI|nr:hypothetical protein J5N97_013122 [Dioscorea zingiberensis]
MRHRLQWLDKREEATQLVIDSMAKSAAYAVCHLNTVQSLFKVRPPYERCSRNHFWSFDMESKEEVNCPDIASKVMKRFLVFSHLSFGLLHSEPSEEIFADLGHFSFTAIQIGFYVSGAESVRCLLLVIAILASVVGSQAIISGTFSIINQSLSLGCFPRLIVVLPLERMLVSKII